MKKVRKDSIRVFHPLESARVSREALGMLLRLTNSGAISPSIREEALNAAMWLNQPEVTVEEMDQIVKFLLDRRSATPPRAEFVPPGPSSDAELDPKRWN